MAKRKLGRPKKAEAKTAPVPVKPDDVLKPVKEGDIGSQFATITE